MKTISLFFLFTGFAFTMHSQPVPLKETGTIADSVLVNSLLKQSAGLLGDDQQKAIEIASQAKDLAEKIGFLKGQAYALKNIGLAYYYKGSYIETLQNWEASLKIFEEIKYETGIANLLGNIGAVFAEQGNEEKGLDYSLRSLKLSEKLDNKLLTLTALNTIGNLYFYKPATKDKALEFLLRALPLCEETGNTEALGTISENIGEIYLDINDFPKALDYFEKAIKVFGDSVANSSYAYNGIGKVYLKQGNYAGALTYHKKALVFSEKFASKPNMIRSLESMANVYMAEKYYADALHYYLRAINIAEEMKSSPDLKDLYREAAVVYSNTGDFKNAFKYQTLYTDVKDTLYNIDTDKKLGQLQFVFDLQKKEGEITVLTKDKALTDQKLKRQQLAKRALIVGLSLVFLIALLIYRNYRIKVKTHKILDRQKGEIEGLLLNILPAEVAKELQVKGHAIPRNYDSVSVMFTDFKGFTTIADKMTPQDLVEELNACFIAFDNIIGKHNLEKIKTIGDSYMCAGGIPTPDEHHVENMVKASLEIRDYMVQCNEQRKTDGLESWDLRIGIHVGPVVAGVVGKKKYAYDIWGSTVNIASRMESNGVPGQVNVSSSVYELVKEKYACSYRGKIHAKNVGEIDMYFLEAAPGISGSPISETVSEKAKTDQIIQDLHKHES